VRERGWRRHRDTPCGGYMPMRGKYMVKYGTPCRGRSARPSRRAKYDANDARDTPRSPPPPTAPKPRACAWVFGMNQTTTDTNYSSQRESKREGAHQVAAMAAPPPCSGLHASNRRAIARVDGRCAVRVAVLPQ